MIRFRLYCIDYHDGFLLASCAGGIIEYHLTGLFREVYSPGRLQVTRKRPYKEEEVITSFDREFIETHPNICWLPRSKKTMDR